jgi:CRISPR-associated protein Cas1
MSGAMTLLVDRRGAELELKHNHTICLNYPDGQRHRVGLYALRRIVIQGGEIHLSGNLLRACEKAGVSIILLPGRYKGNSVNLFPHVMSNIKLRLGQYRAFFDDEIRLSLARQAVATKIEAQSFWLSHHQLKHDFSPFLANLQKVYDNANLMGIEGSTSQQYFAKWRTLWDNAWEFKERNRRPPRDPVNALLSLSYTLAGNSLGQMASTYGLDISLGFLHAPLKKVPH